MIIGTLEAILKLSETEFNAGIDKAKDKVLSLDEKMQKVGKTLTKTVSAGMVAAAGSAYWAAMKTANWSEELTALSAQTGLTTAKLQELDYISKATGAQFTAITGAASQLQANLLKIAEGEGPAAAALGELGVAVLQSDGSFRSMNDLFPEIIAKLQAVENPAMRNALAMQIFGSGAANIAPILGMTGEQAAQMAEEFRKFGHVLDEADKESLRKFNDSILKFQTQLQGFITQFLTGFMQLPVPVQVLVGVLGGLIALAGPLMQFVALFNMISASLAAAGVTAGVTSGIFSAMWTAILGPIGLVIAAVLAVGAAAYTVYKNWGAIKEFFVRLWAGVVNAFQTAWKWIANIFYSYTPTGLIFKHWEKIKDFFADLWDWVYDATVGRLTKMFKWIIDNCKIALGWLGLGGGATTTAPTPAATTTAGTASTNAAVRNASASADRSNQETAKYLKEIARNTKKAPVPA